MPSLDWSDIEGLGLALYEARPETDPLTVRFTELRDMLADLPGWCGDLNQCNEAKLEAVQMAWLEEYQDNE